MLDGASPRREELDFVLASLDDLEAEHAAGDLDESDYTALKSDYTTRAARLIRAADKVGVAEPVRSRSWGRISLWTALIAIVAGLAGVLIADFSGSRGSGVGSGDIRETVRERKFEASQLLGSDPDAALEIYDGVLEDAPSDAEALAYRGWLTRLSGDPAAAQEFVENAVLSEPDYPDARVFAAAIALDLGEPFVAAAHVAALDEADVSPFIEQLVSGQGLRIRIVEDMVLTDESDSFVRSGLSVSDVNLAAESVLSSEPERGIGLYDTILAQDPDNVEMLSYAGFYDALVALEAGVEAQGIMELGYARLSHALDVEPADAQSLVFRAFVGYYVDALDQSRLDLEAYDELDAQRDDLENFLFQFGLREALE